MFHFCILDILIISYCKNPCFVVFSCLKNILSVKIKLVPMLSPIPFFFFFKSATEVNGHHKHSQFIIECGILEKQGYKNYLLIIRLE